jgi:uncharacterized protein (DUF302 family)
MVFFTNLAVCCFKDNNFRSSSGDTLGVKSLSEIGDQATPPVGFEQARRTRTLPRLTRNRIEFHDGYIKVAAICRGQQNRNKPGREPGKYVSRTERTLSMSYCYSKTVEGGFDEVITRVTEELKKEGFGILTEIDVKKTLKEKLDVDFRKYRILGACNPPFAYRALQVEPKIGAMLPCNVIVQEAGGGQVEVSAIDPVASMQAVDNPNLGEIASEVQLKLKSVVEKL